MSLLGGLGSNKKHTDSNLYKHPIASIALDRNPALYTLGNNSTTRPEGAPGISTLQALTDSSGSGKGMPLLVQMTISRQFNLVKQIGEVIVFSRKEGSIYIVVDYEIKISRNFAICA